MPTLADIAQACGTSKTTVSKVLNGDYDKVSASKREEIELAIGRMQYQPSALARNLSKRRSNMIGVVTYQTPALFTSQYYATLINAILDEATAHKQTLALFNGQIWADEKQEQLIFADGRVDGLIVINSPSMEGLVPALLRTKAPFRTSSVIEGAPPRSTLPFVAVNSGQMPAEVSSIDIDDVEVGQTATRYLVECGHRRIAFIHYYESSLHSQARLQGYRNALVEASIPFDERLVFAGDALFQPGYNPVRQLTQQNLDVTAIFCAFDKVALRVIQSLKDGGFCVPRDYSVVGVGDIPDAALSSPPLTTIRQFLGEMGVEATRMLLKMINDPTLKPQKRVWPTELKVRNSVSQPFRPASL
jgi:DNA-binding LacI/PurR family transcriptional regulator